MTHHYLVARIQGHPHEQGIVDWRKYAVADGLDIAFGLLREAHGIEDKAPLIAGVWYLMQDPVHVPCTAVVRGVAPSAAFGQYRAGDRAFYDPSFPPKLLTPYTGEED